MLRWIATGFCLLRIWTAAVGPFAALQACVWVIFRKAFPGFPALSRAVMPAPRILEVRIPDYSDPFFARWPASDLHILHTIVRGEEYAPLTESLDPEAPIFFLDLGANIGDSTRYFLHRFPHAHAIAVEPGSANASLCRRNLACLGNRARVIEAAVWSHNTKLAFRPETHQTGTEAQIRLRELNPGESATDAVDGVGIPTLLAASNVPSDTPVVIKIDIEGGEADLFSGSDLTWLDRVSRIAIELHDEVQPGCSERFFSAVADRRPAKSAIPSLSNSETIAPPTPAELAWCLETPASAQRCTRRRPSGSAYLSLDCFMDPLS